jgi:hypothetical protein
MVVEDTTELNTKLGYCVISIPIVLSRDSPSASYGSFYSIQVIVLPQERGNSHILSYLLKYIHLRVYTLLSSYFIRECQIFIYFLHKNTTYNYGVIAEIFFYTETLISSWKMSHCVCTQRFKNWNSHTLLRRIIESNDLHNFMHTV